MKPSWELQGAVSSQESFLEFVRALRREWDERHHLVRKEQGHEVTYKKEPWENANIPDFLEAMEAWVDDSAKIPSDFDYRTMALILSAATAYE